MLIYLVQHAEAKKEEDDPARDLTDKGRRDLARVADLVGRLRLAVSQVFHSGKTRALTTAEILAAALRPAKGISPATGLAPLDDPRIWAERISRMDGDILLVGHLPHLARLAALLISGDQERSVLNFKMGGMVALRRRDTGPWAVEWMIIPEILHNSTRKGTASPGS
jgi:phosphohistidine phosphatase